MRKQRNEFLVAAATAQSLANSTGNTQVIWQCQNGTFIVRAIRELVTYNMVRVHTVHPSPWCHGDILKQFLTERSRS